MRAALGEAIQLTEQALLGYLVAFDVTFLLMIVVASAGIASRLRRGRARDDLALLADPSAPAVSIVVPAHDEELVIVASVRSLLALRYPRLEIVVVDDGSTDGTFEQLRAAFDLVPSRRVVTAELPMIGRPTEVHRARDGRPVVVVRKPNTGRRSDALNVGICAARHPLVCMIDADSLLEDDALLRVVRPFVDDPVRTVAVGGAVRPVNGSRIERGRLTRPAMAGAWLPDIQVVEYLRSFLFSRTAWSRLGGLLVISGAFGVFRRDVLVEVGGVDLDCIGEDAELVVRIHHRMRRAGRPYRVAFLPDPVCWTEVPASLAVLARQRRRWSRGLAEVLWRHRAMMGNPRYGVVGLAALPWLALFELVTPVVELAGLVVGAAAAALGLLDPRLALLVAVVSLGNGLVLSAAALTAEELTFHRYPRWRDLALAARAALLENLGYRQLHTWWRLQGLVSALSGRAMAWGSMERAGFAAGGVPTAGAVPAPRKPLDGRVPAPRT